MKGIFWGLVYGGLAFAVGFSTIVAIGGDASKRRVSGAGAMFGGVLYAILLALINFSLQTEYSKIKDVAIPTLNLAKGIHPVRSCTHSHYVSCDVQHNFRSLLFFCSAFHRTL